MPLLQGQPFRLVKSPETSSGGGQLFVIQHTGEKFVNKSDYDDRLALYSQSIWTCQCSGRNGLTHQDAWLSEAKHRIMLATQFPVPLHAPLLHLIHHSTKSLDQLVDAAHSLCNSKFFMGEELTYRSSTKTMQVCVVSTTEVKTENGCHSDIKNGEDAGCNGESSPVLNGESKPNLMRMYEVRGIEDKNVIKDVLAEHLQRTYKVPSKEHLRFFIRSNALRPRASASTPWVVSEECVRQHSIPGRLASIFTARSTPMSQGKRKSEVGGISGGKKARLEKGDKKKKTLSVSKIPVIKLESSSDSEEECLASLKSKLEDCVKKEKDDDVPLASLKIKISLKNNSPKINKVLPALIPVNKVKIHKADIAKSKVKIHKNDSTKSDHIKVKADFAKFEADPGTKVNLESTVNGTAKKPRDRLKQSTLLNLKKMPQCVTAVLGIKPTTPATGNTSPRKRSVLTSEMVMRLPIIRRLIEEHRTLKGVKGQSRKLVYTMDLAIRKLAIHNLELITDESLKRDIMARRERVMEKRILAKMTPEDREEYLKQKAQEEAEKRHQERTLQILKGEDSNLTGLIPLPQPILVPTPEVVPNALFGDVAMVTEFVQCFEDVLLQENRLCVSTSQLLQALEARHEGFKVVADIICVLLRVVIHDDKFSHVKELGVALRQVPINYQTAGELSRLCLGLHDPSESESRYSDENGELLQEEKELCDELLEKLETKDLFELEPQELIAILKAMCHKVLASDSIMDYIDEIEGKASKLYKERAGIKKLKLKEELEEKKKKREERMQKKMAKSCSPKKSAGRPKGYSPKKKVITLDSFYGKSPEVPTAETLEGGRRKRVSAGEARKEREAREKEIRERRRQEIAELKEAQRVAQVAQQCEEVLTKRDFLLRQRPLGTDRTHRRYWVFHGTTPGVFVEDGWVDVNSTYTVEEKKVVAADDSEDEKPLSLLKSPCKMESPKKVHIPVRKPGVRGRPKLLQAVVLDEDARTFPPVGQNTWYYYSSMLEVEALIEALSDKGLRESQLKSTLNLQKPFIEKNLACTWSPLENLEDGSKQLLETLKDDIVQIENELVEGWLGGVPGQDEWEQKVTQATSIQELGMCLLEAQKNTQTKMLQGIMCPVKKALPNDDPEVPTEYEEVESVGLQKWKEAVENCFTFSRLHMLVGMFDSCIKWEKSMATKKCKICRSRDKSDPLMLCDKCESSYHWYCLRPQLREQPMEPWLCHSCCPRNNRKPQREGRSKQPDEEGMSENDTDLKHESTCRVCNGKVGLIQCCLCPAAYHSECHVPPLLTRARKDWACVDCVKGGNKRSKRAGVAHIPFSYSELTPRPSRAVSRRRIVSDEDSDDEEEDDTPARGSGKRETRGKNIKTERKSQKNEETRRSCRNVTRPKNYVVESDEEENLTEEEEEEEDVAEEEEEDIVEEEEQEEETVESNDTKCFYCEGDSSCGSLLPCLTCPTAFHKKCAQAEGLCLGKGSVDYQCQGCLQKKQLREDADQ